MIGREFWQANTLAGELNGGLGFLEHAAVMPPNGVSATVGRHLLATGARMLSIPGALAAGSFWFLDILESVARASPTTGVADKDSTLDER